jgi:hypothetical protein
VRGAIEFLTLQYADGYRVTNHQLAPGSPVQVLITDSLAAICQSPNAHEYVASTVRSVASATGRIAKLSSGSDVGAKYGEAFFAGNGERLPVHADFEN